MIVAFTAPVLPPLTGASMYLKFDLLISSRIGLVSASPIVDRFIIALIFSELDKIIFLTTS